MDLKGKKVTVHDMTLRDGMHPKRHLMSLEQMKSIATGLDAAGVPLIEAITTVLPFKMLHRTQKRPDTQHTLCSSIRTPYRRGST